LLAAPQQRKHNLRAMDALAKAELPFH